MPMSELDRARTTFLDACEMKRNLEKSRWSAGIKKDGGYAWEAWNRQYQAACSMVQRTLQEKRLLELTTPRRTKVVRLSAR